MDLMRHDRDSAVVKEQLVGAIIQLLQIGALQPHTSLVVDLLCFDLPDKADGRYHVRLVGPGHNPPVIVPHWHPARILLQQNHGSLPVRESACP
jgi:hypothetical protein